MQPAQLTPGSNLGDIQIRVLAVLELFPDIPERFLAKRVGSAFYQVNRILEVLQKRGLVELSTYYHVVPNMRTLLSKKSLKRFTFMQGMIKEQA